jgi:hypothetical protein
MEIKKNKVRISLHPPTLERNRLGIDAKVNLAFPVEEAGVPSADSVEADVSDRQCYERLALLQRSGVPVVAEMNVHAITPGVPVSLSSSSIQYGGMCTSIKHCESEIHAIRAEYTGRAE